MLLHLKENPIFLQTRGLTHEKFLFTIIKFRTIKSSEIKPGQHHSSKDIFLLPNLAINLNAFEKWLRKTGLDELPQIYNVLAGQMSFIGPRPLMVQDLEIMKYEFPHYYELRGRINSKPGITGVWQIIGDRTLGVENLIGLDLFYGENKSFKFDLNIILATIPVILFAKNSDAIIPRVDFISKLFSLSIGEFVLTEKHLFKHRSNLMEKSQSYIIKIPWSWWFMNDTYTNSKKNRPTLINISEQEKLKRKAM